MLIWHFKIQPNAERIISIKAVNLNGNTRQNYELSMKGEKTP